ncbi:MAG: cupredoxin domain-containing protein [Thermoanaerobaculia bacterium]
MTASRRTLPLAAALLAAAFAARPQEAPSPPSAELRKITITAKKFEFTPSRIELKAGEPVEITLQSEDAKHGFVCKELGVAKVVFQKDKPATVKLTAEKPGTYEFKCARYCGSGHGKMKGEIVVTAPEPPGN